MLPVGAILLAIPAVLEPSAAGLVTLYFIAIFTAIYLRSFKSWHIVLRIIVALLLGLITGGIIGGIVGAIGPALLLLGGMLSIVSKYLFIAPETKFKKLLLPIGVLVGLGLMTVMGGAIAYGNLLIIGGASIFFNKLALPIIEKFQKVFLPWLEEKYSKLLNYALAKHRPVVFFIMMFVLMGVAGFMMMVAPPKTLFFPENQPKYVNVFIQHPIGTDIKVTNQTTLEVERIISEEILPTEIADTVGKPQKEWINSIYHFTSWREGTSDPAQGVVMGNTPHKARVTINFSEFKFRGKYKTSVLLKKISDGLKGRFPADVQINVAKNSDGPPTSPPINIEVSGEVEYDDLIAEAERIRIFLDRKNVAGVEKLKLDVETGKPELQLHLDRDKARLFNVSTGQIGNAIRTALFGADISTYKLGDETYDIVVRFDQENRNDLDALLDQKLIFRNNKGQLLRIPIRSMVKEAEPTQTYSTVVHKDLVPMVTISSGISEGSNPNEVVAELQELMGEYENEFEIDPAIDYKFTGEQEEQAKEMEFLSLALLIALFLILMIIVLQFNAFRPTAIIGLAVIFSFIGVLLGLVIFQMEFVIMMTMIGIISLAGVVVNNAIVLIDYTNLLRRRRREELELGEF